MEESIGDLSNSEEPNRYLLSGTPSGLALVVNILNPGEENKRRGSDKDVTQLKELLPQLGIEIFSISEDITKADLSKLIEDFKRELIQRKMSCSFVALMSHGVLYNMRMSCKQLINIFTDVMGKFSDKNFPAFIDKPKVFIFQACQHVPQTVEAFDGHRDDYSNMIYLSSSMPGCRSQRNPKRGTYFIQTLLKIWADNAWNTDLEEMAKLLQLEMRNVKVGPPPEKNRRSTPVYVPLLFSKKFYFNLSEK